VLSIFVKYRFYKNGQDTKKTKNKTDIVKKKKSIKSVMKHRLARKNKKLVPNDLTARHQITEDEHTR